MASPPAAARAPPLLPRQRRRRVADPRVDGQGARRRPAAPPGAPYHPVPRGAIYTLARRAESHRDGDGGGPSGSATATLSVTRDNVFLGNLLVASYALPRRLAVHRLGSPRQPARRLQPGGPARREPQVLALRRRHERRAARPAPRLRADGAQRRRGRATTTTRGRRTTTWEVSEPGSGGGHPREPAVVEPLRIHPGQSAEARGPGLGTSPWDSQASGIVFSPAPQHRASFAQHREFGMARVFRHQDVRQAYAFTLRKCAEPESAGLLFGHAADRRPDRLALAALPNLAGPASRHCFTIEPACSATPS